MAKGGESKSGVRVHIGVIPEEYKSLNEHLNELPAAARRWQLLDLAAAGLEVRKNAVAHPAAIAAAPAPGGDYAAGAGNPDDHMDVGHVLGEYGK